MKNVTLISILFVAILGCTQTCAQGIPIYPIPSSNINVNGYANFMENRQSESLLQTEGKRVINVDVNTPFGYGDEDYQARIWVYSLDNTSVLGPFTVNCNEPLSVIIDDREWGVLAETNEELIFSVWIDSQN